MRLGRVWSARMSSWIGTVVVKKPIFSRTAQCAF